MPLITLHEDQHNSKSKNRFHIDNSILYAQYLLHFMDQVQK
jgi:hypothetical protein